MIFALLMGMVVGFLVSRIGRKAIAYDDKEEFIVAGELPLNHLTLLPSKEVTD